MLLNSDQSFLNFPALDYIWISKFRWVLHEQQRSRGDTHLEKSNIVGYGRILETTHAQSIRLATGSLPTSSSSTVRFAR